MEEQPGLGGIVPFRFACQRSGRCCSGGAGRIWVEEGEIEGLAAALGMSAEAFASSHLRRVHDPGRGARLSLREAAPASGSGAACALLREGRECTAYAARPRHCRSFPFWPSILEDAGAFERARQTCPGIAVRSEADRRERAFEELRRLYEEVDAAVAALPGQCVRSGECCRFERFGHELYATALEADYAVSLHPEAPPPEASGRCPYHRGGACTARAGRPLGCRTFFCDAAGEEERQEAHEEFLARLRRIERARGYPAAYAPFPALLRARGVGGGEADGPSEESAGARGRT